MIIANQNFSCNGVKKLKGQEVKEKDKAMIGKQLPQLVKDGLVVDTAEVLKKQIKEADEVAKKAEQEAEQLKRNAETLAKRK